MTNALTTVWVDSDTDTRPCCWILWGIFFVTELEFQAQFVMARFCVLWRVLGYGKLEQLLLLQIV